MKIRTDFVTNSSSSSFILAFNNKDIVEETLRNEETLNLQDNNGKFTQRILKDVFFEDNRISIKEIIEYAREEFYWTYKWNEQYNLIDDGIVNNYSEVNDWINLHPEEFNTRINQRVENSINELKESLKDKEYITCIEYGDDDGNFFGELEHEIVPKLNCCICSFSHH